MRSTGRDVRSLVGYLPKETLQCCRLPPAFFTDLPFFSLSLSLFFFFFLLIQHTQDIRPKVTLCGWQDVKIQLLTKARRRLPCPLLTTVLAKSRRQTEWASPPESKPPPRPSAYPGIQTLQHWRVLMRSAQGNDGERRTETAVTTRAGHGGLEKLHERVCTLHWWIMLRMTTDEAMDVRFGLRLHDRAADHARLLS